MNIELNYTDCGEGEPLVFIHGNNESNEYFENQLDFFEQYYRVIAPDTRGHGKTPRGEAPFTLDQFADDLLYFLNKLGIEKAIILGFSDGGNIALLFTLKHPQRVKALIINGANLNTSGVKPLVQASVVLGHSILKPFSLISKKSNAKREMLGLMIGQPNIKLDQLGRILVPTLVIVGTQDIIRIKHTESIAQSIPNSELKIIEGSHFCARENKTAFNSAVWNFLSHL